MKSFSKALSSLSAVLFLSLTIIACGGSGGGSTTPPDTSDSTPESFTFAEITDAELSNVVESDSITISGIDTAASVSISGGEYSLNGGDFTSSSGNVTNGQTIAVRVTSSAQASASVEATLTVGGVSGTFRVTTRAVDTTPENFTFAEVTNAERSSVVESESITVSGIDTATSVSISVGEYSLDGGDFTNTSGNVTNGQTIVVRVTSSPQPSTSVEATLTVGGVNGTFRVTTRAADTTPDTFSFIEQTDVALDTTIESNEITVTGINAITAISIENGEYSVAGSAFIDTASTVENGDTVIVRVNASAEYATQSETTLTIGTESAVFQVTTIADITPDSFSFIPQKGVAPDTLVESNSVSITGLGIATSISIIGGEYSIDGDDYTNVSGTIENGQSVVVRQTSSNELETTTSAVLTVGDTQSAFDVTTEGSLNFESVTGIALNARQQTRIIVVNNIGDQTPISIENGEYQLDRGTWTDQDGFINNGQEVRVRTRSGDDYNVTTIAKLSIGESWGEFKVTTKEHGDFISVWKTQTSIPGVSDDDQITLPLEADGTYNFIVEWGDGTSDTITQWDQAEVTHTYPQAGEYTVTIRGEIIGFTFNNSGDKEKLLEIQHWGDLRLGNSGSYFAGAKQLNISANDALNLDGTTSLDNLFYQAENMQGDISNWDVSSITSMGHMFALFGGIPLTLEKQPVTKINQSFNFERWDVSSVQNMSWMFLNADYSILGLENWDVSAVTDMNHMFYIASEFNGDISQWDVSSVTNMMSMFSSTSAFNRDISQWDVSSVTNMMHMFSGTSAFNGDISQWDVSLVTNMRYMFYRASAFNGDISQWDVSSVINMSIMFSGASAFNSDISLWDVSSVTNMTYMFYNASAFNSDLSQWDVSSVTDMNGMLHSSNLSTENYSAALNAWSQLAGLQEDVVLGASGINYNASASAARDFLMNNKGWSIIDSGEEPAP